MSDDQPKQPQKPEQPPADASASKTSAPKTSADTKSAGKGPDKSANAKASKSGKREAAKTTTGKPRRSRGWLIVALVLLIVAGGAGGGTWYLWQRLQRQDHKFAHQLSALQSQVEQDRASQRAASAEFEHKLQALREQQHAAQNAIEVLRNKTGRSESEWLVAEAEYLIRIANDRLQLSRDVGTALAALKAADGRLRLAGDPALLGARKALAQEIQALRAVNQPDVPGLSLTLGSLIDGVNKLPLRTPASGKALEHAAQSADSQSATGAKGPGWRGVLKGVWHQLKSLVVIRHTKKATRPLLPPNERFFLTENLRLQLEQARLALMRGDAADYRRRIATAQQWLHAYFNTDSAATRGALQTLAQLAKQNIHPALPDISGSLRLLERYRANLHQPAAKPHAQQSAPTGGTQPKSASGDAQKDQAH